MARKKVPILTVPIVVKTQRLKRGLLVEVVRRKQYWFPGDPGPVDIFDEPIRNEFIHGRVKAKHVKYGEHSDPRPQVWGYWIYRGIMTPESWQAHGLSQSGDRGDRYKKTDEGWLKVEG